MRYVLYLKIYASSQIFRNALVYIAAYTTRYRSVGINTVISNNIQFRRLRQVTASSLHLILRLHELGRQQCRAENTAQRDAARQVQDGIDIAALAVRRPAVQALRNQRADDAKKPAPEAGDAAREAPDRRRERLGRPAVQDGVEHGLEKVLEREQALALGHRVDGGQQKDGRGP